MDLLWRKESSDAGALFVDIFKNIPVDHPGEYSAMCSIIQQHKKVEESGFRNRIHQKNDSTSMDYRTQGNVQFQQRNWLDAMNLYNKSLCFAEIGSENVSLAYGNRSACFFHLKIYEKCLVDIELAKKANYPERLMSKLEKRRIDCLKLMETETAIHCEEDVPKLSYDSDENFPGMANVLKIESNAEYGRYVVAKCDIDVGKTVLVEEAFISKKPINDFNSCTICLKTLANFIACDQCSNAMFCGSECAGDKNVHEIECGNWFDTKTSAEFFVRMIWAEMTAFSDVESWMKFVEDAIKDKGNPVPSSLNDATSKYRAFLHLNIMLSKDKWIENMVKSYKAFVIILLNDSIKKKFDTEQKKRFLMHLIYQHICAKGCNAYSNKELNRNAFIIRSYFNHSCVPNLFSFEHKNLAIGTILRPIKKGQQLFSSYTGDYILKKPVDYYRKNLLEKFHFQCNCERCAPDAQASEKTSFCLKRNPEFRSVTVKFLRQPNLDFEREMSQFIDEMCINLLNEYGHMHWCKELGYVMQGYAQKILRRYLRSK